jgi:acetyl esterase/lipase
MVPGCSMGGNIALLASMADSDSKKRKMGRSEAY